MCKGNIRREESEKSSEKNIKKIMIEIFPNLWKNVKYTSRKLNKLNGLNLKRSTDRYTTVKVLKVKTRRTSGKE